MKQVSLFIKLKFFYFVEFSKLNFEHNKQYTIIYLILFELLRKKIQLI